MIAHVQASIGGRRVARDVARALPVVARSDAASVAVRLFARHGVRELIVRDERGSPITIVSAVDVLHRLVPSYIDTGSARLLAEAHLDVCPGALTGKTVGDCLPEPCQRVPSVPPHAGLLEVAAAMAAAGSPAAAVVQDGVPFGVITTSQLLDELSA
jgi:CBS domain-containing protein